MPYSYIEHISDIGIKASAPTLQEAFEAGAEAMLNVMFDLGTIDEAGSVPINAEAGDIALLFVEVLNEVLSIQGRDSLALKRLKTREIKDTGAGFAYCGEAFGEGFDPEKHAVKTEVKGATYSGLQYTEAGNEYTLQCILDV
ncbi:MAG: archease [Deltaproteobacteria bacterium]|nr:archease [Deltaproteobacteria bacterium]